MNEGIKTMIGKLEGVRYHGKHYTVEGEYSNPCLSKDEFRAVMLPRLTKKEREYYDKIKQLNNGDKRAMTTDLIFGVLNGDCMDFEYGGVYRVVEAVVKGGYNS